MITQQKPPGCSGYKVMLFIFLSLVNLYPFKAGAQDTFDLQFFLKAVRNASPVARQLPVTEESSQLRLKNTSNTLLPEVTVNAQAAYNSETVQFGNALSGMPVNIPELPLDQYKVWAEINQVIFSGGTVNIQKKMELEAFRAEYGENEAALYMLKQNVTQLYFGILLAEKNISALNLTLDELSERTTVLSSGVEIGAVLPDVLMSLKAEMLKIEQLITESEYARLKLINNLAILSGTEIDQASVFAVPGEPALSDRELSRQELKVFDYKIGLLDLNKKLVSASDMPKIFAFSQLAYGRPGFDILSTDFHGFYNVGVGLKWDFLNYGQSKRNKKLIELQQDVIEIKKDLFNDQLKMQLDAELEDMAKYTSLLKSDMEVISLRKSIAEAGFSKLRNGVISPTDYLSQLNNELLARLQMENHKIMKIQAMYNFLFLQGKL